MTEQNFERRRLAATAGRKYMAEELSWDSFIQEFSASEDELISDLVDIIEHEPKKGGFMCVSEAKWGEYRSRISNAIEALERQ